MEYFDVCDENGEPTGETVERSAAHRDGIRHRTAHVWITRERNGRTELLLQKRSRNKDSFPGLYDTSSAGHIPAGAEPLDSALRELWEELGLRARPEELVLIGTDSVCYEKHFHGRRFRDNEFIHVYLYTGTVDERTLRLQEDEVERVDWFDLEEVSREIAHSRERFCVPSETLRLLRDYLTKQRKARTARKSGAAAETPGCPRRCRA